MSLDELDNSADAKPEPCYRREQAPARTVPSTVRLTYYDRDRDYLSGEARATAGEQGRTEVQRELPCVLAAADAKALAQQMLARAWAERDTLHVRLPPTRLALEPGTQVDLPFSPSRWTVQKVTIDGFVIAAELKPSIGAAVAGAADGGRVASNSDVVAGTVSIALLDLPTLYPNSPTLLLAASSPTLGWKRTAVDLSFAGQSLSVRTAGRKSVLGSAVTELPSIADTSVIDTTSSVDVQLIDSGRWLLNADDIALNAGANLALIGGELVQFGSAISLGGGRFKLQRLLRGRLATEIAVSSHAMGEVFCLIETGSLQTIGLPVTAVGTNVSAQVAGGIAGSLTVSARAGPIPPPSGGTTVDAEARSSIDQILSMLRQNGLIGT